MIFRKSTVALLALFSILFTFQTFGDEQLDEKKWSQLSKDLDYSATDIPQEPENEPPSDSDTGDGESSFNHSGGSASFGSARYFILGFLLVALVVIIILVMSSSKSNIAINDSLPDIESVGVIEEKIHEVDLDDLLRQALEQGKWQIAIRISFLMIIKKLSQQRIIEWTKEKTNWEYYDELKEVELRDQFREMVIDFERTWYGEMSITQAEFQVIDSKFRQFGNTLADENES